jgi:hypothetical protein
MPAADMENPHDTMSSQLNAEEETCMAAAVMECIYDLKG